MQDLYISSSNASDLVTQNYDIIKEYLTDQMIEAEEERNREDAEMQASLTPMAHYTFYGDFLCSRLFMF